MRNPFSRDALINGTGSIVFLLALTFVLIAARTLSATHADDGDSQFVNKAAAGGMSEIKLGQLAVDKGSNSAVKEFGQRMVTDHSKANQELKEVASRVNIALPDTMTASDQALYESLSKLSGPAFDRAYARAMVKDHEDDVTAFQRETLEGKNTAVKEFALKTVPTLKEHLQLAREMQKTVSASASAKK
jgi:putative membrane protein